MEPELIGPIAYRQLKVIRSRMELQHQMRITSALEAATPTDAPSGKRQEEKSLFSSNSDGF